MYELIYSTSTIRAWAFRNFWSIPSAYLRFCQSWAQKEALEGSNVLQIYLSQYPFDLDQESIKFDGFSSR